MRGRRPLLAFFVGVFPVFAAMGLLPARRAPSVALHPPAPLPSRIDWLAVVTGSEPAAMQHSLVDDALDAKRVFGPGGVLLLGGGPGSPVQLVERFRPWDLRARLAAFFDPRDRAVTYVPAPEVVDGPARWEQVAEAFRLAAQRSSRPLFVYLGGHGEGGQEPAEATVPLWGGTPFGVRELLQLSGRRPLRLVQTACFGGGFAELVFRSGDANLGVSDVDRCGLFATSWDQEASGCDPDPERAQRDGYSRHFFDALLDRGRAPRSEVDLDGDGAVSLLEAHTQARIASRSIDVPTTTSERWLLEVVEDRGLDGPGVEVAPQEVREELAVVRRLGRALGYVDEDSAQRAFAEMQLMLREHDAEVQELAEDLDAAYFDLRIRLLERWPRLDDPWDTALAALLAEQGPAIEAWLSRSPEAEAYQAARAAYDEALARLDALEVQWATLRRLVEAWDTLAFARRVREREEDWATFRRIRACERSIPSVARRP